MILLHGHYDPEYVRRQRPAVLARLLIGAAEREQEICAWELWLMHYLSTSFGGGKLIPFDQFMKRTETPVQISNDDYNDIVAHAETTKKRHLRIMKNDGEVPE